MSSPFHLFLEFALGATMFSDLLFWQNPGEGCDSCNPGFINVKDNVIQTYPMFDRTNLKANIVELSRIEANTPNAPSPIGLLSSWDNTLCLRDKDTFEFFLDESSFPLSDIPTRFGLKTRQVLITNCEKYSLYPLSFSPVCSQCKSGYIPDETYQNCYLASSSLSNCLLAKSSNQCRICQNSFSLTLTKTCEALTISHCQEYAYLNTTYNSSNSSVRCIRCENGYFSENGTSCQKITMPGCQVAFNADTCIECVSGKFLFENGFVTECRDLGERVNCSHAFFDLKEDSMYCLDCGQGDFIVKKLDFTENTGEYSNLLIFRLQLPWMGSHHPIFSFENFDFHIPLQKIFQHHLDPFFR